MRKNSQHILSFALKVAFLLSIVCSTAYLLMLGWYSTLLLDDYGFAADVTESGAYGLMRNAYMGWQPRFSAFYVLGWIFKIWGHASNLVGYTIFLLLMGYGSIYYALRQMIRVDHRWMLLGCAVLITNISILAYLEFSTFYWVCCALYTLSAYAAVVLLTAIFFSKGKIWSRWLAVILSSLYISGGAENFTPIIIAILGCILLYKLVVNQTWRFWETTQQQLILVSLVILCLGFVLVITGPGTHNRAERMSGFMYNFTLLSYCKSFVSAMAIFLLRLLSRSLYYVLLLPIGFVIGARTSTTLHQIPIWKHVLFSSGLVLFVVSISVAAPVFGMGWYSPLRSYSFLSFVISFWVVYLGAACGPKIPQSAMYFMLILSTSIVITYSIYYFYQEQPLAQNYHKQIAECNATIQKQVAVGRTEPLIIQPVTYPAKPNTYAIVRSTLNCWMSKGNMSIASPAIYFPYEHFGLTKDPENWKNSDMRRYHNAQFDIIGWENPEND